MWRFGVRAMVGSQPPGQTVGEGQNAVFSVGAGGSQPLFYQWQFDGTNIPGATASTYVRSNATPFNAGYHSVIVSNLASVAVSSNATLTVVPNAPTFGSITALPGGQFDLAVSASSGGMFGFDLSTNLLNRRSLTNFVSPTASFDFTNDPGAAPWLFYRAWRR